MVAVFLSGIIGRFIYIQIPRSIEGRELSLNEIREMKSDNGIVLKTKFSLDPDSIETILESTRTTGAPNHFKPIDHYFRKYREKRSKVRRIKSALKKNNLSQIQRSREIKLVKNEISINRRIDWLQTMQNLFKYWHVVHLPFAFLMLIIIGIIAQLPLFLAINGFFNPELYKILF